jgi:hypothetical protein
LGYISIRQNLSSKVKVRIPLKVINNNGIKMVKAKAAIKSAKFLSKMLEHPVIAGTEWDLNSGRCR